MSLTFIPVLTKYKNAARGKNSITPPSWLENFESEKRVDTAMENEMLPKAKKISSGKMRNGLSGMKISLAYTPIPIIIAWKIEIIP